MSAGCIQPSVIARLPYTNDSGVVNADLATLYDSPPRRGEPFVLPLPYAVKQRDADVVAHRRQRIAHRAGELLPAPCPAPLPLRSWLSMKDYLFGDFIS
jgi:hypothetical protein